MLQPQRVFNHPSAGAQTCAHAVGCSDRCVSVLLWLNMMGKRVSFSYCKKKKILSRARRSTQKLLTIHALALPILLYSLFPVQLLLPNKCFMSPSNRAWLAPGEAERERKERELEIAECGGCVLWGLSVDGWIDRWMGGWTDVKNVKFWPVL